MDMTLDIILVVFTSIVVLLPLFGINFINTTIKHKLKRITPAGWMIFGSVTLSIVISVIQLDQRRKKELRTQEADGILMDSLNVMHSQLVTLQPTISSLQTTISSLQTTISTLQSTLSSIESALKKEGFRYDRQSKKLIPIDKIPDKVKNDEAIKPGAQ